MHPDDFAQRLHKLWAFCLNVWGELAIAPRCPFGAIATLKTNLQFHYEKFCCSSQDLGLTPLVMIAPHPIV